MRKDILILGIILTSIYSINAMAAWPTKPAENIWTDPGHTTLATEQCSDCCKTDCWLPDGTYYDAVGTFTNSCGLASCPSGQYDIGFGSCIKASTGGSDRSYWEFGGYKYNNPDTYGLSGPGQWGVTLYTGDNIKGIASCNSTPGTQYAATDQEFSNTANGKSCWCKMTEPAASRWVFYADLNSCALGCTTRCALYVQNDAALRSGLFGSVTPPEPAEPTCDSNRTYSMVNGVCKKDKLSCPSGQYDIGFSSCIDASTNGTDAGYINDSTGVLGASSDNTATYDLTTDQTWGVTFDYGIVKGIASCNSTESTFGVATTTNFSQSSTGQYCWCKMTEPSASRWVFADADNDAATCASSCAAYCALDVLFFSDFRSGVFGSVE